MPAPAAEAAAVGHLGGVGGAGRRAVHVDRVGLALFDLIGGDDQRGDLPDGGVAGHHRAGGVLHLDGRAGRGADAGRHHRAAAPPVDVGARRPGLGVGADGQRLDASARWR